MVSIITRQATSADLKTIAALHALTFGPGRYTRTAYRIREGSPPSALHSRVALQGEKIIAALTMTPVTIGNTTGAALLGPVAVDPAFAKQGAGRRLISESLIEAKANNVSLIILVGDMSYYERFGMTQVPLDQIELPGPFNPARLLAAELEAGAIKRYSGLVRALPE